jgi:hypothetical protein
MSTAELKSDIHKIVDGIQNEQLLRALYDFLKIRTTSKPGQLWNSLTEEQKKEVLSAYDESEDQDNLVERDQVYKKTK